MEADVDLDKRAPLRPLRLADQMHARFNRRAIGLLRVTDDARADDVLPRCRTTAVARDDVIEVQVLAVKFAAAILAGVAVALENIVPRELDFLLRHAIKQYQEDHARKPDSKRHGVNALRMRFLLREILPLAEIERLEGAIGAIEHDLRAPFKQERQGSLCRADIHRLPEAI